MKTRQVLQPNYVEQFRCVGGDCIDHCCKNWTISLDKNTYNKYLKHPDPRISNEAKNNLILVKKNNANWASIKCNSQGDCPYFDPQKLCSIHRIAGESALSPTCKTYPRTTQVLPSKELKSLTLSCPEACRQVLFNPAAMGFTQSSKIYVNNVNVLPVTPAQQLIHNLSTELLIEETDSIIENLYAVGTFLFAIKTFDLGQSEIIGQANNLCETLKQQLVQGAMADALDKLPGIERLQWAHLFKLSLLAGDPKARGAEILTPYINNLMKHITAENITEALMKKRIHQLHSTWQDRAEPYFAEHRYIWVNYLFYRFYNDYFPYHASRSPLEVFYLIISDFKFLRSLMAAWLQEHSTLTEEDIIRIIYSYHNSLQHNQRFQANLFTVIKEGDINEDIASLILLKTC